MKLHSTVERMNGLLQTRQLESGDSFPTIDCSTVDIPACIPCIPELHNDILHRYTLFVRRKISVCFGGKRSDLIEAVALSVHMPEPIHVAYGILESSFRAPRFSTPWTCTMSALIMWNLFRSCVMFEIMPCLYCQLVDRSQMTRKLWVGA